MNCGDWVESCTAIIETHAGELRVIRWSEQRSERPLQTLPDRTGQYVARPPEMSNTAPVVNELS